MNREGFMIFLEYIINNNFFNKLTKLCENNF